MVTTRGSIPSSIDPKFGKSLTKKKKNTKKIKSQNMTAKKK